MGLEVCLGSAAVVLAPVLPDSFGEVLARVIRQFRLPHRDVGKLLAFDFTPGYLSKSLQDPRVLEQAPHTHTPPRVPA